MTRLRPAAAGLLMALGLSGCGGGGGGGGGNPSTPDTTPPDTQITGAPPAISNSSAASFTAVSEAGASFQSSLDGAAFAPTAIPLQLAGLVEGTHTIAIRSVDAAGNIDASPATFTWQVDTSPPDTQITAAPVALTSSATASFTATSPEAGVTFESSLDGAAFVAANMPLQLAGLSEGAHSIAIRARDVAGNVDATPATFEWQVDVTPPTGTIVFPLPVSYTDAASLTVRGTAQDTNGVASVRVNGVAASTATAFGSWTAVVPVQSGQNQFVVSITDLAGNTNAAADTATAINRGPVIASLRDIDYDPTGDRLIVSDQGTDSIYAYRVSDGVGSLLSNSRPPNVSPGSNAIEGLVVDAANNRALVVDFGLDALVAVDLARVHAASFRKPAATPQPNSRLRSAWRSMQRTIARSSRCAALHPS